MNDANAQTGWWRSNRYWLFGAALLGVVAFVWPYREALDHYQRQHPQRPIDIAPGAWGVYEGARWRVIDAKLLTAAQPGKPALPRPDAAMVVVRYEVVIDKGLSAKRIDACQGRLSDAQGRQWEANPTALSRQRSDWPRSCGSYLDRKTFETISAPNGRPFRFEHVYLVPKRTALRDLHPEIRLPQPKTPGAYLRFSL